MLNDFNHTSIGEFNRKGMMIKLPPHLRNPYWLMFAGMGTPPSEL